MTNSDNLAYFLFMLFLIIIVLAMVIISFAISFWLGIFVVFTMIVKLKANKY